MRNKLFLKSRKEQSCIFPNKKGSGFYAFLFILPSLLGVCIFKLVPFADVLKRSFYRGMSDEFFGIGNYISILSNEAFRLAAANTLRFIAVCIPVLMAFSMFIAVIIGECRYAENFFKTTSLIPMALPAASLAFLWKAAFHKNGLVNGLIIYMGGTPKDFMGSSFAFYMLIICYLWRNTGYNTVLWSASLSNISTNLYEAASVDGAGPVRQFFLITLPGIKQDFFIIGILSLINSFKVFREAYLVAGSYPHTSMYLLQHLFNNWFASLDMDKLCAGAVMTAGIIFFLILLLKKISGGELQ